MRAILCPAISLNSQAGLRYEGWQKGQIPTNQAQKTVSQLLHEIYCSLVAGITLQLSEQAHALAWGEKVRIFSSPFTLSCSHFMLCILPRKFTFSWVPWSRAPCTPLIMPQKRLVSTATGPLRRHWILPKIFIMKVRISVIWLCTVGFSDLYS